MDIELMDDLRAFSQNIGTISELDRSQAQELINKIADAFVVDRSTRWWWENLSCTSKSIDYGNDEGLEILRTKLVGANQVFVVVTDDEFPPWPVFKGPIDSVLELIAEQRYFEYFLIGENKNWCIFDTHHNHLIMAGDLME